MLGQRLYNLLPMLHQRLTNKLAQQRPTLHFDVVPTLEYNIGPTKRVLLALRWANVWMLTGYTVAKRSLCHEKTHIWIRKNYTSYNIQICNYQRRWYRTVPWWTTDFSDSALFCPCVSSTFYSICWYWRYSAQNLKHACIN